MNKWGTIWTFYIDSETTDPVSLEDVDDDDDSNNSIPTTPMDDSPKSQNRVSIRN